MESLGGNSKTTLIICCSPEKAQTPETISTLRFGERAKRIQNHAKVNEDFSMDELKSLLASAKKEIEKLKKMKNVSSDNEILEPSTPETDESASEVINNLTTSLSLVENENRSLNSRGFLLEEELETLNSINMTKEEVILNLSAEKEALNNTVKELEEKLLKSTIENIKQKDMLSNVNSDVVNVSDEIDNLNIATVEALQEQSDIFKSNLEDEMRNLEKTISSKENEARYAQESATNYADKYLRLREEYDSHIGQLMVKLTLEQQMRTHVEDRLEDALGRIHKANPNQVSGFFNGLINLVKPDESKAMSTREFNMAKALDQQYSKVLNLQEEISHNKEAHQIVLETKESVMRSLVKQNSALTTEKNTLTKRMEEQCVTIEQLTKLLRSVQSSKNSPIRPLLTNTNTIRGGSSATTSPRTPIFSLTSSHDSPNTPMNSAWRSVSPKKDIKSNIYQNGIINDEDIQLNINTDIDNE
jgi:kinesin family protein 5